MLIINILQDETRKNIPITNFGYDDGGTFDFKLVNFTVPEEVVSFKESRENRNTDKYVSNINGDEIAKTTYESYLFRA